MIAAPRTRLAYYQHTLAVSALLTKREHNHHGNHQASFHSFPPTEKKKMSHRHRLQKINSRYLTQFSDYPLDKSRTGGRKSCTSCFQFIVTARAVDFVLAHILCRSLRFCRRAQMDTLPVIGRRVFIIGERSRPSDCAHA